MRASLTLRELPDGIDFAALHALAPKRYPCLLQSVAHGTKRSRYDLLLAFPNSGFRLDADGRVRDLSGIDMGTDFLAVLNTAWQSEAFTYPSGRGRRKAPGEGAFPHATLHESPSDFPYQGGWALYLGYELAVQIEPRLTLPPASGNMPVALALRCPAALIRDHETGRVCAIVETDSGCDPAKVFTQIQADIEWLASSSFARETTTSDLPSITPQPDAPEHFLQGVQRILDYIRAGDIFQVNLSRGWQATLPENIDVVSLYQSLRHANPAPFAGLFAWDDWAVLSSSPERLLSVHEGTIETRPIAGTRPRFAGDDDAEKMRELIGHPKERAEHIMLIDLMRNDLSRVAQTGSVVVDELMTVESYAHVHHIVSNVRANLREDKTPVDAIRAVFPGGTITGCPKVRCMEIIAELETTGRGPYTGSFGYLDRTGNLDLNILIRTLWLDDGHLRLRAGAGIVADSQPAAELAETQAKARGLLRAVGKGSETCATPPKEPR